MKKFIINSALFGILLLTILFFIDKSITFGLRKSKMITYNNLSKLFHSKINADLIINGSSKAYVQVSPKVIDSILHLNSHNLGLDGTPFTIQNLQYDLYKTYNKKPKIIIQIVSSGLLVKAEGDLYNYIKFAPYLDHDNVVETTKLYNGFSYIDYKIPLLKYSGKPIEVIDGALSSFNFHISSSNLHKGFLPQNKKWDGSFEKFKKNKKTKKFTGLDETTSKLFEEYVRNCKEQNITLFLVYPPLYEEYILLDKDRKKVLNYFNHISTKYNTPFFDFSNDQEISPNKKYFYNSQHLNKKGANLFSKKLGSKIKTKLTEIKN